VWDSHSGVVSRLPSLPAAHPTFTLIPVISAFSQSALTPLISSQYHITIQEMVTGIETAGLVLGSVPLLILAIEKWHKGFVKTRDIAGLRPQDRERIAMKINGLAGALKRHNSQLNINLKSLLKAADPNFDLDSLPHDYRDQLWKEPLGDSLNNYLRLLGGDDAVEGFRSEIEASKALVEEIGQHFRQGKDNAVRLFQAT
jgi:hypothetical protein